MSSSAPRREPDRAVRWARTIARILDDYYLDALIGLLVPGAGDALTSATGLYLVGVAIREKLPAVVIARMLINLSVDALVGVIPLAGDLFDFAFKANKRNLRLLEERHVAERSRPSDWLYVGLAAALCLAALALPIVLMVWLARVLF